MRKLKKMIVTLGLACLLSASFTTTTYASDMRVLSDTEATPRWSYLQTLGIDFDINSSGKANCFSVVVAKDSLLTCKINSTLYRLNGGTWEKVTSFTASGEGVATAVKEIYVKKGYVYVLRSKFMVYNAAGTTLLESHTEDYEVEY